MNPRRTAPQSAILDPPSNQPMSSTHELSARSLKTLARLFSGLEVRLDGNDVRIGDQKYPIVDGVIILLPRERWPRGLQERVGPEEDVSTDARTSTAEGPFSRALQDSFGAEWTSFSDLKAEHRNEFEAYFDQVDLAALEGKVVADLGCGMGRWSHFLCEHTQDLVLVDFSEAIWVARKNLKDNAPDALFFLGDVTDLPFSDNAFDFAFSLGVLHHLPIDALDAIRRLSRLSPSWLFYLYYALDNRPAHFRTIFRIVDGIRRGTSRIKSPTFRSGFSTAIAVGVYKPLVGVGHLMALMGKRHWVPLAEGYQGASVGRLEQDVYDRFFTTIENRYSRQDIQTLSDTFSKICISETIPYWHFTCSR